METWKPIADFPLYEISDSGNIKRLAGWQCRATRPRNASLNQVNGYMFVTLCRDSKKYMRYVHRLVAEAFIGIPKGMTVNHKNGNKRDNRLENIEVGTQRQNMLHAYDVLNRPRPLPQHVIRDPKNGRILGIRKYLSN